MKIICEYEYEWIDETAKYCEPHEVLQVKGDCQFELAGVFEHDVFIRYPGIGRMPCESIEDGKAKVMEHLRSIGALAGPEDAEELAGELGVEQTLKEGGS